MNIEIQKYNSSQTESDQEICSKLSELITYFLSFTEAKIWHSHPVWFIDGIYVQTGLIFTLCFQQFTDKLFRLCNGNEV